MDYKDMGIGFQEALEEVKGNISKLLTFDGEYSSKEIEEIAEVLAEPMFRHQLDSFSKIMETLVVPAFKDLERENKILKEVILNLGVTSVKVSDKGNGNFPKGFDKPPFDLS